MFGSKNLKLVLIAALISQTFIPALAAEETDTSPFSTVGPIGSPKNNKSFTELPTNPDAAQLYAGVLEKLDPSMSGHNHFIVALENLAFELEKLHYFEQAEALLKRAEKLTQTEYLQVESLRFKIQLDLANLCMLQKKYKEAIVYARKARDDADSLWEPSYQDPQPQIETFQVLSETLIRAERHAEALQVINDGLAFLEENKKLFSEKKFAENKIDLDNLRAECLSNQGDVAAASKAWLQVIAETEKLYRENVGFADMTVDKYLKFMHRNGLKDKAARFEKEYMLRRLRLIKQTNFYSGYQAQRILKTREAENRARQKKVKPQRPADPTKKQEANAGSLS